LCRLFFSPDENFPVPNRPLRILQILRAPVGGLFRHVVDLSRSLAERGHEVGIVLDSLASDAQTESKLEQVRPLAKLGIFKVPMPRVLGPGDLTAPLAVRKLARGLRIDVVHGHGAKGGLYARLARIGQRKLVALYTPHGGVLHFAPRSPSGRLFHALERGLMRATDAMIFESKFAAKAYGDVIGPPKCPTEIIYNGLAPTEFEPVQPAAVAKDFLFVGEFRALKGLDPLLSALETLKAPDGRPATIVMAGNGPDFEPTRERIEKGPLAGRVTLAGVRPAREMFALGRVVVVPSLAESLPYIVLEASAAGRPVIATAVGGIAEIFGPTAGQLIPAGNADALRAAMSANLANPTAALAEAQDRLAFIRETFSLSRMTDRIEALYRTALDQH
jgi:glycosyltransferase involved in cell wall biosynthesis